MYGQSNSNSNVPTAASVSPYQVMGVAKQTKVLRCIFDLETTGLSRKKDDIVEISAQLMIEKELLEEGLFHSLVKPRMKIPMDASAIHGITDERVERYPTFDVIGQKFMDHLETNNPSSLPIELVACIQWP